jgi:hypothetical protein
MEILSYMPCVFNLMYVRYIDVSRRQSKQQRDRLKALLEASLPLSAQNKTKLGAVKKVRQNSIPNRNHRKQRLTLPDIRCPLDGLEHLHLPPTLCPISTWPFVCAVLLQALRVLHECTPPTQLVHGASAAAADRVHMPLSRLSACIMRPPDVTPRLEATLLLAQVHIHRDNM